MRKTISEEQKEKISKSMVKAWKEKREHFSLGEKQSKAVGKGTKGKFNSKPNSIIELSLRTARKVLERLKLPCSRCGWNEGVCDLHHIKGKKIENCNSHENISYICPNCHRLIHSHKIKIEELIPISKYLPENWRDYYYG